MFTRLPIYIGASTLSLFVVITAVLAGVLLTNRGKYPDPFTPYEALVPGQPISILANYSCHAQSVPSTLSKSVCDIAPNDGYFRLIQVITDLKIITSVDYNVGHLQVIDLVTRWGRPDQVQTERLDYLLHWNNGVSAYVRRVRRFNYQLNVMIVMLASSN